MSISLKSNIDNLTGSIQINDVDVIALNSADITLSKPIIALDSAAFTGSVAATGLNITGRIFNVAANSEPLFTADNTGGGIDVLIGSTLTDNIGGSLPYVQIHGINAHQLGISRYINNNFGVILSSLKSRGAGVGSRSSVLASDRLLQIQAFGVDSTNIADVLGAELSFEVESSPTAGVVPGRMTAKVSDTAGVLTEAIRFTATAVTTQVNLRVNSSLSLTGYTVANPASGSTVTLTTSTLHYQNTGTGTKAALTFNMPAGTDGQEITIATDGAITSTLWTGAAIVGAPTTLGVGGFCAFIYILGQAKWYRKG